LTSLLGGRAEDPASRRWQDYSKQKFDGLVREELQAFLVAAQRATGRFGNVQIGEYGESLLCIH
jgi:hypothetical protein